MMHNQKKKLFTGLLTALLLLTACNGQSLSQSGAPEVTTGSEPPVSEVTTVTNMETEPPTSTYTPEPEEVQVFEEADRLLAELSASVAGEPLPDVRVNELFEELETLARSLDEWLNREPVTGEVDADRATAYAAHALTLRSGEGMLYVLADPVSIGSTLKEKVTPAYESYFTLMATLTNRGLYPLFVDGFLLVTNEQLVEAVSLIEPFCQNQPELAEFHSLAGMLEYAKANYGAILDATA